MSGLTNAGHESTNAIPSSPASFPGCRLPLREYPDLEREDVEQALAYAAWLTQEEVIIA